MDTAHAPGDRLGSYTIDHFVASGGVARVYRAHGADGVPRAIKLTRRDGGSSADQGTREMDLRALREGRIMATLRHPNVAQVVDVIEHDGRVGLVMEWVDGPTLTGWLATDPPLAQREVVFRQIGQAIDAANQIGVLHRDLKPDNVIVARTPGGPWAKVIDFGSATAQGDGKGRAMGTPRYAAPEQIRSSGSDSRADVWSLGVIWYEMLTGRTPFEADDPVAAWQAATKADWPPPSKVRDGIPPRYDAVCAAALRASPNERPDDVRELLGILDGVVPADPEDRVTWTDMSRPPLLTSVSDDATSGTLSVPPAPPTSPLRWIVAGAFGAALVVVGIAALAAMT